MLTWAGLLVLAGCPSGKVSIDGKADRSGTMEDAHTLDSGEPVDTGPPPPLDSDNDGFDETEDCDDEDPSIHPDADEHCDGIDEDCDEEVDEDAVDQTLWFLDADGDGYGSPSTQFEACEAFSNAVDNDGDCDDSNEAINPSATEVCGDDLDNDCDGEPGDCIVQGILSTDDADATVYGTRPGHACGAIASRAGDVDADGRDDLIIGLPMDDRGTVGAGIAAVLSGPIYGDIAVDEAGLIIVGSQIDGGAGAAVTSAGYINDDMYADLAIGAPGVDIGGHGESAGAAFVFFGGRTGEVSTREADTQYQGEAAGDYAGSQVASAGDIDGDGRTEIAVAAEYASDPVDAAGVVYIVSPGTLGTFPLAGADVRLHGATSHERAGHSLQSSADLNDDGSPDLLVGAPYFVDEETGGRVGRVYIVFGGSELVDGGLWDAGFTIDGTTPDAFVGFAIATPGDLNEDGHSDLVVSSMNADSAGVDAGAVYVLFGPFDADRTVEEADHTIYGEYPGDMTGHALANAGDFNRDGRMDLLIGSNGNDYGDNNAGAAYILFAPIDESADLSAPDAVIYGTKEDDWAGSHQGPLGDMDADGAPDIFVSTPNRDGRPPESIDNAGSLHIFYGNGAM